MSIQLKEINQLTATSSKNALLLIPVDVPSGGDFDIRKITKEDLFKILGHAINFETSSGGNDIVTFDAGTDYLRYINAGGPNVLLIRTSVAGLTSDGTTLLAGFQGATVQSGNASADGALRVFEGGFSFEIVGFDLTQSNTVSVEDRSFFIQAKPVVVVDVPTDGGNVAINNANAYWVRIINPAGTLASLTITFPPDPKEGDMIALTFKDDITTLTLAGNGNTIDQALTTASVGTTVKYIFTATGSTWYQLR